MIRTVPLMFFAVLIYNLIWAGAWVMGISMLDVLYAGTTMTMASGGSWKFTLGDLLVLVSLALLFLEMIKATHGRVNHAINRTLSAVVLIVALIEFIVAEGFSTSTFLFIIAMCLFDTVAGFTLVASRRSPDMPPNNTTGTN